MTEMPAASVEKLLTSKGGDSWIKTLRRGIQAARRDGRSYYIGATALAYYIEAQPQPQGLRFVAHADGRVEKA